MRITLSLIAILILSLASLSYIYLKYLYSFSARLNNSYIFDKARVIIIARNDSLK